MISLKERKHGGYLVIEVEGRIDGLTSPVLDKAFEQASENGSHRIVTDFSQVSYISSAGLRIFLKAQKKLKPVGGEIILMSMKESAADVFRVSGLHELFRTVTRLDELSPSSADNKKEENKLFTSEDSTLSWEQYDVPQGKYAGIGNPSRLRASAYRDSDILSISQSEIQFGLGLAAVGDSAEEARSLLGEAVLLNHNFYGFPAVEIPAVDYAFLSKTRPGKIHFLYGLRFSGDYRICMRFDPVKSMELIGLARKLAEVSGLDFFGMVLLGKSDGIFGLNLRKAPWQGNAPSSGDIMHESVFADWFDFPVEDTDLNKTVVAAGIYSNSGGEEELHVHGVVFGKGLVSKTGMDLNAELHRIIQASEPLRVVHLLAESRFSYGIAGLIAL